MKKYGSLAKILMSASLAMVGLTVLGLLEFQSVIVPIIAWVVYGAVICIWSLAITRKGPFASGFHENTGTGIQASA